MTESSYLSHHFHFKGCHLNHASMSPLCQPVQEAISGFLTDWSRQTLRYYPLLKSLSTNIKQSVATLLQCDASTISIQANTATSFSILAQGLSLSEADDVLLVTQDFPSVTLPFLNAAKMKGSNVRFITYNNFLQNPIQALEKTWTPKTRLLAFSWVGYMSGIRASLDLIVPFCHARNAFVAIDATQGLVACPFSLKEYPVDFIAASLYKWFLSPQGTAFFYVAPRLFESLNPVLSGWLAAQDPTLMVYDQLNLASDASRFENGGLSLLSLTGASAALTFLKSAGISTVQTRTLALSKRLSDGLLNLGYPLVSEYTDTNRSGIVTIDAHEGGDALFEHLNRQNIFTTYRLKQIRFSPYFYQSNEDIDKVLDVLRRFLK